MKNPDTTTKALFSEAIKQHIQKKNWKKLAEVMLTAERAGVSKALRRKGWLHVGEYEASRGNHAAAVMAFNSARMLDLRDDGILGRMIAEYEAFHAENSRLFSFNDLATYLQPILRLSSFYQHHAKASNELLDRLKKLRTRITSDLPTAKDVTETPVTHAVNTIYSALYPDTMTPQEVRAEFARLFVQLSRDEYERRVREKKKGKKKRPKNPVSDKPEEDKGDKK